MSSKSKSKKEICAFGNCSVKIHGDQICAAISQSESTELMSICYITQICCAFSSVLDSDGRTALHTASFLGKTKVVQYLLKHGAEVNHQEAQLKSTPLHFAVFSGNIDIALYLLKYGADPKIEDKDGLTPIHYIINQQPIRHMPVDSTPILQGYSWGINSNYNLGLASVQAREFPEYFEVPFKEGGTLISVSMNKFHTLFLSTNGKVFACGHGRGGRIGIETNSSIIIPQLMDVSKFSVRCIATGMDHSVFLTSKNEVLTCGTNTYHQLGICPPPQHFSVPHILEEWHSKYPDVKLCGVAASTYHTVIWSPTQIFTCGLNAGQLGHTDIQTEKFVDLPRCPPFVKNLDKSKVGQIKDVVASEGATVFYTSSNDVYAIYEYKTHHIPLKMGKIKKVACYGGIVELNTNGNKSKTRGEELRIAALNYSGDIFVWANSQRTQYGFFLWHLKDIFDFCLHQEGLCLVTIYGEALMGYLEEDATKYNSLTEKHKSEEVIMPKNRSRGFDCLKAMKKGKIILNLYRTHSVFCDPKGKNFIALQYDLKPFLTNSVNLPPNTIHEDIVKYYNYMSNDPSSCDVEINADNHKIFAHSYILCHNSDYLYNKIKQILCNRATDENEVNDEKLQLPIDEVAADAVEDLVSFMYTREIKKLKDPTRFRPISQEKDPVGKADSYVFFKKTSPDHIMEIIKRRQATESTKNKRKKILKINYPLKHIKDGSCTWKMRELQELLIQLNNIDEMLMSSSNERLVCLGMIPYKKWSEAFDREKFPELYDVAFRCKDGQILKAHKCIVMARSSYFEVMLGTRWNQALGVTVVDISLSPNILIPLLDFLYTSECAVVANSTDIDFLCELLSISHQYMVEGLYILCQRSLSKSLTFKNAVELLRVSFAYELHKLQEIIIEFIALNMAYFLDSRSLKELEVQVWPLIKKGYVDIVQPQGQSTHKDPFMEDTLDFLEFRYLTPNEHMKEFILAECQLKYPSNSKKNAVDKKPKANKCYYTPRESNDLAVFSTDTNPSMQSLPGLTELKLALLRHPEFMNLAVENWFQIDDNKETIPEVPTNTASSFHNHLLKRRKKKPRKPSSSSFSSTSTNSGSEIERITDSEEPFSFEDLEDRFLSPTYSNEDNWTVVGRPKKEFSLTDEINNLERQLESTNCESSSIPDTFGTDGACSDESSFPTLSESLATSPKLPPDQIKRMPKFQSKSSKKTKTLRNVPEKKPSVPSKCECAWGNIEASQPCPSLADLLNCGVETSENTSKANDVPELRKGQKHDGAPASSSSIKTEDAIGAEIRVHWNPVTNNVVESPKEDLNCSFSSILQEEEAYTKHLQLESNKPLSLIQLEEKAMKELLEYYGGPYNPEERVTVTRVEASAVKPSWNIQYRKV